MNIAIIGSGAYGIAVGCALAKVNRRVKIWTESQESLDMINSTRTNFELLGGIALPDNITFSTSFAEVVEDADLVFLMVAAKYMNSVCENISNYITKNTHFIIGSKGVNEITCDFMHKVLTKHIKTRNYGVISGPTFAIDIANGEPSALACATKSRKTYDICFEAFKNSNIKVRHSKDIIGVELCGTIKNVIALATGILDGLGCTESTRAFFITECVHGVKKLIIQLGGDGKTVLSYAGIGDILLTSTSTKSRNYTYGKLIATDRKAAEEFLETHTVEGYNTLKIVYKFIKSKRVSLPAIDLVYKVAVVGADPHVLVEYLMNIK
jgi:glycerol-3-phosphate dehydrogenase (NAD(P)+)